MKKLTLGLLVFSFFATNCLAQNYNFKDTMSRAVLELYLSKAISMQGLLDMNSCFYKPCGGYDTSSYQSNLRMLERMNARFIGRSCGLWGSESLIQVGYFKQVAKMVQDINSAYALSANVPPIIQAGMFEYVSDNVNKVAMNELVCKMYNEPKRNFDFKKMAYDDYPSNINRQTTWASANEIVPDISKKETQMWFYFLATNYIDNGIEALHFGNIGVMDKNDSTHSCYWNLLRKIRTYAQAKNRGLVLCDAHTVGSYYGARQLLFDFHSAPVRVKEIPRVNWGKNNGGAGEIVKDYCGSIYGKSQGGLTYFGWQCSSLPYLVELDNYGLIASRLNKSGSLCFPWGYDEISWFANQSPSYKNKWLIYAYYKVKKLDPNASFEMPGIRGIYINATTTRLYQARATKDNQESTIDAIWRGIHASTSVKIRNNK